MQNLHKPAWMVLLFGALSLVNCSGSGSLTASREISMVREYLSPRSIDDLERSIENFQQWPHWHVWTRSVESSTPAPQADSMVRFKIEPPDKPWKRFELQARITRFVPRKILELQLLSDSTGKITRMLSDILWRIELEPASPGQTLIRATVSARTQGVRSGLLAVLVPRILLNQVLYADLDELAGLKPHLPDESRPLISTGSSTESERLPTSQ